MPVLFCKIPHADAQSDRLLENITKKRKCIITKTFFFLKKKTTDTEQQKWIFIVLQRAKFQIIYNCMIYEYYNCMIYGYTIYEFSCPASNAGYNGKTDQNFDKRIKEDLGLDF